MARSGADLPGRQETRQHGSEHIHTRIIDRDYFVRQDTYGTYAELRHSADGLLRRGHDKAPDIEAQRDYMDMVCRSYAARLEKRRNLLITSVRFHRLAEEVTAQLLGRARL